MPRRGLGLAVLIVNQLLAGVGVATGMALAAILTTDLTGALAMGGLAQSSSVLGAAIVAVPLAKLAVRSGRHVALATGYALAFVGAVIVIVAAASAIAPLVFLGLAAFGAAAAASLQARFAATEVAVPGFEARSMSLVLWATTIGSVAGPLLSQTGDTVGQAIGLPPLVGPFVFSAVAPTRLSTVSGAYGTLIPAGLSIGWAAAPRVQTPSSLTLAMPTAAASSGSSPPVVMNGAPIGRGIGMAPSSSTAGKMKYETNGTPSLSSATAFPRPASSR